MLYRLDPDSYKSNEGQIKDAFCHDLTILVRFYIKIVFIKKSIEILVVGFPRVIPIMHHGELGVHFERKQAQAVHDFLKILLIH